MSKIEARIEELGITLPEASAPVGNYVGAKVVGNMVYLSGNGPLGNADSAFKGKVGSEFSLKEGYAAARAAMINLLGTLNGAADLLGEGVGDAGRHARSAIPVPQLPMNLAVEIEMIVKLKDE